jgi:phage terminase small subunit
MPLTSDPSGLTVKQRLLIDAYFRNGYNAAAAAREAKYQHPEKQGWEQLNKPVVRAEIDRRLSELEMGAPEVVSRISDIARTSMADCIRVGEGGESWQLDLERAQETGAIHRIKKLSYDRNGKPAIELYPADHALEMLARKHRLFVDRTEISGPEGGPLALSIDEMIRRVYGDEPDFPAPQIDPSPTLPDTERE